MPSRLCTIILTASIAVATQSATAQTAYPVDLNQFQGVWHEVARSPNLFQRNCCSTTAEYRVNCDGSVSVINRCATRNGQCKTISGTALATNGCNNQLVVSFPVPFGRVAERRGRANYIIHYVSPDYQRAVVGTPRGRLVWLLSRTPQLSGDELQQLKNIAAGAGYQTNNLIQ